MRGIVLALVICAAKAAVNESALPLPIAYNTDASVGPDGPWWFITATVGPREEKVDLIPGYSASTLVIGTSACSAPSAQCPAPINGSLQTFDTEGALSDSRSSSENLDGDEWGEQQANILNLQGFGQYYAESIAFPSKDAQTPSLTSDGHSLIVSNNYFVQYPEGDFYTLGTGFLSLYAGLENASWTASNGSEISRYRTLAAAYRQGFIPSESFGIHVGSVDFHISGSLTLGGYDRSRCITEPIVSDDILFTLLGVSLGVAGGNSSFLRLPEGKADGLLRANGSEISEIKVRPNPGMPYIYLPQETCDAIATHLPVTFSRDWNLYLWDVEDPAYKQIVRSPHYLSFGFASGGLRRAIDVPFALLNLTLDEPLTQEPTPYFPCSPWLDAVDPFSFGRAFLQGAFLAQNWQEGKLYLAQAPGPDYSSPDIRTIAADDSNLRPLADAPEWLSTWTGTFEALSKAGNDNDNNTDTRSTTDSDEDNGGTSKGVIAGAVVGAIVGVALIAGLVFWLLRRRKQGRHAETEQGAFYETAKTPPPHYDGGELHQSVEPAGETLHEVAAEPKSPQELYGSQGPARTDRTGQGSPPVELAAEAPR